MEINIQIGALAETVEEFKNIKLENNCEVDVRDLGCKINTPTGLTTINEIIKKENLSGIKITLENGVCVKCAKKHILRKKSSDVFAENLSVGEYIQTKDGEIKIVDITSIPDTTFYDIGIDYPHLYYDADGILHHNTIITATLAKTVEKYGRSILIVPSKSLVTQTQEDYINVGLDVGVVYGDKKEYDNKHLICTWQSLNSVMKSDAESFIKMLDGCVCVMVDECHSIKGNVLKDLLTGVFSEIPIRWALTGTIPKEQFEFRALQVAIGEVINSVAASDLQDQGVLAKCSVNMVQLVDYSEYKSYQDEVSYLLGNKSRLDYIASMIEELEGNTLVLVDRIASGEYISQNLSNSVFVKGTTKQKDRKKEFTEVNFSDSKRIVATYGVAAVGINITKLHNLVLLEPGKSFVRVIQSIGRGLRKGFDKDEVVIWDISSTCKFSKRHLSKRKQYYAEAKYPTKLLKRDWQ